MTERKQRKYDREKYFCFEFFLSLNISDFSLFFMKNLQSSLKKVTPLFPRKPLSKLQSRQAPMFENLVGDSTSHPTTTTTPTKNGSAHNELEMFHLIWCWKKSFFMIYRDIPQLNRK